MSTNEKYDLRGYQTNKPTIFLDLDGTVLDTDRYKLETYPDIDYPDLPSSFWSSVPWTPRGRELYDFCRSVCYTCILSSSACSFACSHGKHIWLQTHIPSQDWALCPSEWAMAHSKALLIDDYEKKTDAFIQAGGSAYLFKDDVDECKRFIMNWFSIHENSKTN